MAGRDWLRTLEAAGMARARAAEARAALRLVVRAEAALAADGVRVEAGSDGLRLRGRGLRARVLGSRRRAPDPRLAWLAAWLAAEEQGG